MLKAKDKNKLLNYFGETHGIHFAVVIIYFVLLGTSAVAILLCVGRNSVFPSEYIIYPAMAFVVLLVPLIVYFFRRIRQSSVRADERELDEQYLKLVNPQDIIALGKEKFGFSDSDKFLIPPVIFHNYADEDGQSDLTTPFIKKRGFDGIVRSTHIVCLAYFFGEDILFQFGYSVDICGEVKVTVCDDIYYRDISKNIKVVSVAANLEDEKGHQQEVVRDKLILSTKSHGEIRIPFWSSPTQKESFDKMRRHIREINSKNPEVNVEVKYN